MKALNQLLKTWLLTLLLFGGSVVMADELKDYKAWCKQQEPIAQNAVFKDALALSNQLRKDYCLQLVVDKVDLKDRILELLLQLDNLLGEESTIATNMINAQQALFKDSASLDTLSFMTSPEYILTLGDTYTLTQTERTHCQRFASSQVTNASCRTALENFVRAYGFAQATLAQKYARERLGELVLLGKKWDRFANESKAQTSLELLINGVWFNQQNDDKFFQEPPEWQAVFLHPNLVIENVPDALDGEEVKESLLLELVGVDYWQQDNLWLPTGASIVALNVDRNGTSDWGYGAGLIFDHTYLLGFAHHEDDENGIFVSFNILKAFEDKREKLRAFKSKIDF